MVKILVFGDSISWGAFDVEKGGWVERLKMFYFKSFKDRGISVYNFSISGDTTRNVLRRMEAEINNICPNENEELILMFPIGSNDALYINNKENFEVPIEEFCENVSKIIEIASKFSSKIIFPSFCMVNESCSMPWKDCIDCDLYWENVELERYQDEMFRICYERNIPVIDVWNLLVDSDLPDGVHPNEKGHEKIYLQVLRFVEDYLNN